MRCNEPVTRTGPLVHCLTQTLGQFQSCLASRAVARRKSSLEAAAPAPTERKRGDGIKMPTDLKTRKTATRLTFHARGRSHPCFEESERQWKSGRIKSYTVARRIG